VIEEFLNELSEEFKNIVDKKEIKGNFVVTVRKEDLKPIVEFTKKHGITHIITITGVDKGDKIELNYHFRPLGTGKVITYRVYLDREKPQITSISSVIPGALLYEREVKDLLGVEFIGIPDERTLLLPEDWPEEEKPLRRDFELKKYLEG